METAQDYARRPKRIYVVEKCGFFHYFCNYSGLFICTNLLQTFLVKTCIFLAIFLLYVDFYLKYVSLK